MDIDRLKEFLDLTETLSFTKSARNLNLSQSALSRHIAELEREVGAELLVRSTTAVNLSAAGRSFYERAVTMVRDYESLLSSAAQGGPAVKTTLRVSGNTMQQFPNRFLHSLAMRAASSGSGARLDYYKTRSLTNDPPVPASLDMLLAGQIDLSVEVLPFDAPCPARTEGVLLCYERLLALASPRSPLASATGLAVDDLCSQTPVALAAYRSCPAMELAPFVAAGFDVARAKTVFVQNMLEVPELVATLAPHEVVVLEEKFCEAYRLGDESCGGARVLDVDDDRMRFAYWLVWRAGESRPGVLQTADLARRMVDEARMACSDHPDLLRPDGVLWVEAL